MSSIKTLHDFLSNTSLKPYQIQSQFEFRYPVLFDDDCFLIDQVNFPSLDANTGYIYLDGYKIPVHSTPIFDNEISFAMYVNEGFLNPNDGKYYKIFQALTSDDYDCQYDIRKITNPISKKPLTAEIVPLPISNKNFKQNTNTKLLDRIVLYNAQIKSASLDGGFSSQSIALTKFTIKLSYAYFDILPATLNSIVDSVLTNSYE